MRSSALVSAALVACLASLPVALASASEEKADTKAPKKKDDGGLFSSADNVVPLPVIIAPVVSKGYLVSHLYMFLAAVTPSAADANKVKEKLPLILDALIMSAYRNIPTVASRDIEPNYAPIVADVKATINGIMGREIVTEVEIGRIDTAPY